MKKIEQNSNVEFIIKFIKAYKNTVINGNTVLTFEFDYNINTHISNMIILKNDTNTFLLFQQDFIEKIFILNKKYLKFIKDKNYKTKNDVVFKEKNDKITDSLKSKNNFIYRWIFGNIWKEEQKLVKRYFLKFNTIFIELDESGFNELFNETINIEKNKSLQSLSELTNEYNHDYIMEVIHDLKNIIGEDIFK